MKTRKLLIILLIINSLFITSMSSVTAIEENETINDGVNDVIDQYEEVITEHEDVEIGNIDITEVTYSRQDEQVTLSLKVNDNYVIEDRGKLSDLSFLGFTLGAEEFPEDFNLDTVGYIFMLVTEEETYQIAYVNNECQLIYYSDFEAVNISDSDFFVDNNKLTINFEFRAANETYNPQNISVVTVYAKMDITDFENGEDDTGDAFALLMDVVPNPELIIMDALASNLGTVGSPVEFEGEALFGQPPYIYHWDFGDDETSDEQNPTHIYTEPGIYEYTFTVTDNSDAVESYTDEIEIVAEDDNGTPGFEFIIAITAIGLIFLWKRKH